MPSRGSVKILVVPLLCLWKLNPLDRSLDGPQAALGAMAEEKSHHYPCREMNRGRPALRLGSILTEVPQILTNMTTCENIYFLLLNQFCFFYYDININ